MKEQKPNFFSEVAIGGVDIAEESELFSDIAAFECLRATTLRERTILKSEFVMWNAASADVDYVRAMQGHNI